MKPSTTALVSLSRIRPSPLRFRLHVLHRRSESGPETGTPSYDVEQSGAVWNKIFGETSYQPQSRISGSFMRPTAEASVKRDAAYMREASPLHAWVSL